MKYANLATAPTPQSEPLDERQVQNNAGGYVFQIDDWKRLDRFLILGADEPTYYQKARDLTRQNAACVERCFALDAVRAVVQVVDVSVSGRAPKNDAAIFALALGACNADEKVRKLALNAMPAVCRNGTHLFQFVSGARTLGRGWGRGMKNAVARWYEIKSVDDVAYQVIKYRSREDYTHKRLLQMTHPTDGKRGPRKALYAWVCDNEFSKKQLPARIAGHIEAMAATKDSVWAKLAVKHDLPWEALPPDANAKAKVWQALLPRMGLTALVRNLGNMSRLGVLDPLSKHERIAVDRLHDDKALRKSRLHPFSILQAMAVYSSGKGFRGSNSWTPSQAVTAALEDAFYAAFANVEPTGKRTFVGLDVSGSMSDPFAGSPLSVAEAAAAMAMVTMRTEPWTHVMGFSDVLKDIRITAKDSLRDVTARTAAMNFGRTDCALPMLYAAEKGLEVDVFQIITDNETWHGRVHPREALRDYRKKSGINAKLVVMGMTATAFSIADPADAGMLDVVGMDSNVPAIIADFARGRG